MGLGTCCASVNLGFGWRMAFEKQVFGEDGVYDQNSTGVVKLQERILSASDDCSRLVQENPKCLCVYY